LDLLGAAPLGTVWIRAVGYTFEHGEVRSFWVECYDAQGAFLGEFQVEFFDLPYLPSVERVEAWVAMFNNKGVRR
jgi:hypothetical protein